jgi:hypothetical protein
MNTSDQEENRQLIGALEKEVCTLQGRLREMENELSDQKRRYVNKFGPLYLCRICDVPHEDQEFGENYRNYLICDVCGRRAVTANGKEPYHDGGSDDGDNPLFIDGIKVWRRYKFGGYIDLLDEHDCEEVMEYYRKHFELGA